MIYLFDFMSWSINFLLLYRSVLVFGMKEEKRFELLAYWECLVYLCFRI